MVWTALWMTLHIERKSTTTYLLTVQLPGTIITVLSFGAFWLDVSVSGERIGFGSTMLLTILLLMTIVGESVPKCGELLWIDLFNWVNFGFCVLALLESFWVSYLYHGEHGVEEELIIKKKASEMAELSVAELSAALIEKRHITTQWVDNVSKHFFPAAYVFSIALVIATTPMDNYEDNYTAGSYTGLWPASRVDVWPPIVMTLVILAVFACLSRGRVHRAARKLVNQIKGPAATAPRSRDLVGVSSSSPGSPRRSSVNEATQRELSAASESGLSVQPCTLQVAPGSLIDKKNVIAAQYGWEVSTPMPKVALEAAHDLGITTSNKSTAALINEVHAKLAKSV